MRTFYYVRRIASRGPGVPFSTLKAAQQFLSTCKKPDIMEVVRRDFDA